MSGYVSMVQEVVEGLSRRGHSIEDRGSDWVLVEDENGQRFKISVSDEGSTPLDSPARPCGMHYSWPSQAGSEAGTLGPCVLDVADHHERHQDEHGNEWLNVQWALDRLDAAPAGEVVSVPPPGGASLTARRLDFRFIRPGGEVITSWSVPNYMLVNDEFVPAVHPDGWMLWHGEPLYPPWILQRHDDGAWTTLDGRASIAEPAPVPPPVDAPFAEIDDLLWRFTDIWLDGTGQVTVRDRALVETRRLFAAGVAEGRRQATEERTEEKITPATAYLMPRPRGYVCAAGCGHADSSHRELGCDVDPCECPAPFGRILPSAEATDHG